MQLNKLDKKALKIWYIYAVIESIAVLGAVIPAAIGLFGISFIVLGVVICSLAAAVLIIIWIWPGLKYEKYRYAYDKIKIVVERGVIFRRRIVIPVCQIQDLHRAQGPIMLMLGLSGVEISTAGSNFTLCYLQNGDADSMIDFLEAALEDRIEEIKNEEI